MRSRPILTLLCGVAALAPALAAQSAQRWSIQASALGVGVFGDAYEGLTSGFGGEAQVRVTPSLWSYGFGGQLSQHSLDGFTEKISLMGVFFEPRRVFDVGSGKIAPYLSARLAYLRQSGSFEVGLGRLAQTPDPDVRLSLQRRAELSLAASGFQGNVGGGVLVRMSPRVNLDLGVTLGLIRFGDVTAKVDGEGAGSFAGTSGTGQNAVFRAGLAFGLGAGPAAKPATRPSSRPARR
jgi:hypothetical protein